MQVRYASLLLATAIIAAAGVAGAQTAPAGQDVQSQNGPQAGLLLPAIQKARDASPRGPRPQNGAPATQNAELTPGSSPQHAPSSPPPPPPPPPRPPSGGGSLPGETLSLNFEEIKVTGESAGADDVQQPPSEASHDYFLRLPGVEGESDPPPPPPPPPPAPMHSEQGVSAGASEPQAALIVPAVQRVREAAASEQPLAPEIPICAHCGADVAANQQAAAQAQQQPEESPRERPRRNFSISIGGLTVGANGVNVAVGDVNGDGGNARSRSRTSSSGGSSAGRGSSTGGAPRR